MFLSFLIALSANDGAVRLQLCPASKEYLIDITERIVLFLRLKSLCFIVFCVSLPQTNSKQ